MIIPNYPSIAQFQQLVELKDYRGPTKKEYVRYVRKFAEHLQADPATASEDHLRDLIRSPPASLTPAGLSPPAKFLSRLPKALKSSCSSARRRATAAAP